jgi:hypothetical protein
MQRSSVPSSSISGGNVAPGNRDAKFTAAFEAVFTAVRPHRTLGQTAPLRPLPHRTTSGTKTIRRRDRLGGLLHEYQQVV